MNHFLPHWKQEAQDCVKEDFRFSLTKMIIMILL